MKVINNNKKYNIKYCSTFFNRLIGMMFLVKKTNEGYCFPKCNSIHTFFMFQKIDVYMTDRDNNIIFIYKSLKPFKIILPKKNVYYTYEFCENVTNFKLHEKVVIKDI